MLDSWWYFVWGTKELRQISLWMNPSRLVHHNPSSPTVEGHSESPLVCCDFTSTGTVDTRETSKHLRVILFWEMAFESFESLSLFLCHAAVSSSVLGVFDLWSSNEQHCICPRCLGTGPLTSAVKNIWKKMTKNLGLWYFFHSLGGVG